MKNLIAALILSSSVTVAHADPATFNIDTTHTSPRFEYSHFGFSNQIHTFDKTSGKIVLDRKKHKASVNVTIDAKSVNTSYPLFNKHIQDADFFDTAKYPTITFKSTSVKFKGDTPVEVDGKLTIKGITRPVALKLTSFKEMPSPIVKRDEIGANAVTTIKRSDFNMGKYAPYVSDDVKLIIALEAIKQ